MIPPPNIAVKRLTKLLDERNTDFKNLSTATRQLHIAIWLFCPSQATVETVYIPLLQQAKQRVTPEECDAINYRIRSLQRYCNGLPSSHF